MTERIAAAAIWPIGGEPTSLPPPARHHDVIRSLARRGFGPAAVGPSRQGFVTDAGRYVDRIEGRRIAEVAGQLLRANLPGDRLYSEDLW